MKKLLLIAAAVLAGASGLRAEEYTAISPDGKITVTVSTAPELRWSVTREGERLLDASRIGMCKIRLIIYHVSLSFRA